MGYHLQYPLQNKLLSLPNNAMLRDDPKLLNSKTNAEGEFGEIARANR